MIKVTDEDFEVYESVREHGQWNMFDQEARRATGLDKDTYIAIIRHYNELAKKYEEEDKPWVLTCTD